MKPLDKKLENLDDLENQINKGLALLKEYGRSLRYESCDYHLVRQPGFERRYMLFRIADKKMIAEGNITRIKSYMNIHQVERNLVMDIELLDK